MVRIAVLGCGTMGLKIAGNLAYHGHSVKLYDNNTDQVDTACMRIYRDRDQLFRDGLIEAPLFTGQISSFNRLEDTVRDVQYIFECVFENLALKQELVQKAAQAAPADTIICTNTLQLDLEKISENLTQKQNFIGVRFLFPVYYIREVEINLSKWTNTRTIESVRKLLESMDKVLFFRSSSEPLILNLEQQEARRKIRFETIEKQRNRSMDRNQMLPELTAVPSNSHSSIENENFQSHSHTRRTGHDNDNICSACMDHDREVVIRPCNHFVICYRCAQHILQTFGTCPICRRRIEDILRIYT